MTRRHDVEQRLERALERRRKLRDEIVLELDLAFAVSREIGLRIVRELRAQDREYEALAPLAERLTRELEEVDGRKAIPFDLGTQVAVIVEALNEDRQRLINQARFLRNAGERTRACLN